MGKIAKTTQHELELLQTMEPGGSDHAVSTSEAFNTLPGWRRPRKAADFVRCQLETYEKLLEAFGEHRAARLRPGEY